jgi:hypothetical protein
MPTPHSLLELRTGRDATHTPETALQLFSTLPSLKNQLWHRVRGQNERISFEMLVFNQTIYFMAYLPTRLVEYTTSLLQASYPEIMITPLEYDPFTSFDPKNPHSYADQQSPYMSLGNLKLSQAEYFPLKTYQDFSDIDPLATVLSSLSNSEPNDRIGIQFVMSNDGDNWKRKGFSRVSDLKKTGDDRTDAEKNTPTPYKTLIEKKLAQKGLRTAIKLVVSSDSQERCDLILETLATAFQSISQSEGNSLVLKKPILDKNGLLKSIVERSFSNSPKQHLSLEELATLYHLPNQKLSTIANIAWGKTLLGEPPQNLPIISRDMDPEAKRDINPFARTTFKNHSAIYGVKRDDRRRHMYVIGKTGTGKSTLLANMAINDLKNDEGLCVIDPHGDLVENLLDYIPSRRINDVVYFDPADPERTVKINLFEGENVAHRELIASGIVAIFQKLYAYSWGPRLEYILRNSLLTLLESDQARMSDIVDLLTNKKFRAKVIENLDDKILKNFWVNEFEQMPDRQRTEAIAPILNKVGQFVTSPLVRDVVNASKSSFSIEEIMDEGKILLVNLSQGKLGEDNATLLGAMLITKIQLAAMSRVYIDEKDRRDFYLYVDEFQNFATTSFNKILSEARKYRLNLILANQYIAQIPEEVQKAIFGNCGSMLSFVMGADDARAFSQEFGDKYSPDDLVSLGRYQIVNKITIDNIVSRPFPATTLDPAKSTNKNRAKVIKVSRERYATKKKSG